MKKYKLIAADMDGTLLNNNSELTPGVRDAIRRCMAAGCYFLPATGRPIHGIRLFGTDLFGNAPIITYNGAVVVSADGNEILYSVDMDAEDARYVLRMGREADTTICVWSCNRLYVNKLNDNVEQYRALSGQTPIVYTDDEMLIRQGITKILWFDTVERVNAWHHGIAPDTIPGTSFNPSKPYFLEFYSQKVSKAEALSAVCKMVGVDVADAIAIGDGFNDLPMLERAGLGVAMANAPDEVKARCGYVTSSNEEDGVARVIEKFML